MKKSRRIVKKMSKKSLINKKALRYIIANSNLCKHAIRELELAGYSKEEDGSNKWMREQVIEAVALFSSHGNSGFSAPFEINLVKKLCSFDIISPLRFDDGEWGKIGLDGSCQNKRKSSIFRYKGHKDDVLNRPIERDYRLSRPTKIKKIGKKLILKDEGK